LIHDVIITLGLFSFFQWPVDLTVMAAVLALIGYSINDTIVVADRIRENFRVIRKAEPLSIINTSLTETLSRTLVTSFTTLLVLVALFFFGGTLIHYFSVALIIGVFVGTYSSIYVAANVLLLLNITQEDLLVPVKEGGELVDDMP
jgi:preprotein translocase subunit SecF